MPYQSKAADRMAARLAFPVLLGILGVTVLVTLGTWQLKRLAWKLDVIGRIDGAITGAPVAVPDYPDEGVHNYLPVALDGRIGGETLRVLTSRQGYGPGHRLVAPIESGGRRLLLDLGFLPEGREVSVGGGEVAVIGNLHWPDEVDNWFTPDPDGALWFARDVVAMARALMAESVLVVARDIVPPVGGVEPWPVGTGGIRNDHLQYALTWFGLACAWAAMTVFWVRRILVRGGQ